MDDINWNDWLTREQITLDDCLLLAMGENPNASDINTDWWKDLSMDDYRERRAEALQWFKSSELNARKVNNNGSVEYKNINPLSFFNLARSNDWDLPEPLHELLDNKQKLYCAPKPIQPLGGANVNPRISKVTSANYETWCKADLWTIERAILLLINAEALPGNNYYTSGRCESGEEQALYDNFMEIWSIAESSLISGTLIKIDKGYPSLLTKVKPFEFLEWARSKDFQIPVELVAIANSNNPESQAQTVVNTANADYTTKPWLIPNSQDPEPEQPWYVPARYFARELVLDDSTLLTKRNTLAGKVAKSLDNVNIKKRGGKKPFNPGTIKKALSNIKLG